MGNTIVKNGNPINYIYPAAGTFNITLKATNAAGCIKSIAINNIKVLEKPIASVTVSDTNGCLNIPTIFSNTSTTPNQNVQLTSFLWTFPNGNQQTTNLLSETVSFTPQLSGNLTTTVTATDAFGCVSAPKTIQLAIAHPTASFSMDSVVCDLESLSINNNSSGDIPLSYNWKIDDTFYNNSPSISVQFDEEASPSYTFVPHTISLETTDKHGCTDSISKVVKVSMPKAKIGYSASGATANLQGEYICPPVLETYKDSSISYGTIDSWSWTFGNFFSSTISNPVNSYNFPGIFTTSLSITDQFGCTADTTLTNYLKILGPKADVSWTPKGTQCDHKYEFLASNLITVDSLIWDLNDGNKTIDSTIFSHSYTTGNFHPNVTLIDPNQCKVTYPLPQIDILPSQLLANAGSDQTICQNSTTMAASASILGTKVWHLEDGSGTITDTTSATTSITNLGKGTNTFVWSVKEGCEIVSDTVKIINAQLDVNAGLDQLICSSTSQLTAISPIVGSGNWTLLSGSGNFTNSTDAQSIVNGLSVGTNEFIWTINNQCITISDTIKITVETNPSIPNAGNDQSICEANYQLNGNPILIGTGKWTNIVGSGIISDNSIENPFVTNLSIGQNIFQLKISNTCKSDSSRVTITFLESPTAAKTEKIDPICAKQVIIKGNKANVGTGVWKKVSGKGTIMNPTDSITNVTNLGLGFSIYRWTISNVCGADSADVIVRADTIPSDAVVGKDQTFCGYDYILAGNKPVYGKGSWSILSGYCLIFDSTDNTSGVSNINIGTTELKWSIKNSCGTKSASYRITSTGNCPNEDSLANKLVYFIPNTFTPNGDEINNIFTPVFSSGIDPQDFWMLIYDRWGNVIFESHDPNRGWNGKLGENGDVVTEGIYNWKIFFTEILSKEKRKISGDVLIIK
jgi:gliding motility-associated-like protein